MNLKVSAYALASVLMLGMMGACSSQSDADGGKVDGQASEQATTDTSKNSALPTLNTSGTYPILDFPGDVPPEDLQVSVVQEGDGKVIEDTDFVVANYVGQVWGNPTPFDSSFKRGQATGFSLQQVIQGWTQGLAGQKVGAHVILSIPSELGYAEGYDEAGISRGDTIAFYVEIVDAFGVDQAGDSQAQEETPLKDLPVTFDGAVGSPVQNLKVKGGVSAPSVQKVHVLARGTGAEVPEGASVYLQYTLTSWDNEISNTTYGAVGPQMLSIGEDPMLKRLAGLPVGSRVLIEQPATDNPRNPAVAIVIDVLGIQP